MFLTQRGHPLDERALDDLGRVGPARGARAKDVDDCPVLRHDAGENLRPADVDSDESLVSRFASGNLDNASLPCRATVLRLAFHRNARLP
ncbi:hypothetical protein [Nocardioides iriomotensis]|uniref:hypothetical protein n=1 Tax=Nocardioides iriomotensis TaxID=715784 RepID=UPI001F0F76DB|nr:hypothetical protein [Nocardioides iriomotensis]